MTFTKYTNAPVFGNKETGTVFDGYVWIDNGRYRMGENGKGVAKAYEIHSTSANRLITRLLGFAFHSGTSCKILMSELILVFSYSIHTRFPFSQY